MRNFFRVLCGVAAGLLAAPSLAQEDAADSGLYFSFGGGLSERDFLDNKWTQSDLLTPGSEDFEFVLQYSLVGTAAIGYVWTGPDSPAGFRIEVEGSYRRAELDYFIDNAGPTLQTAEGYLESIGAMVNGYVEFNLGENVVPHIGGGVGLARVSRRNVVINGVPASNKFVHTGAWQVMAGVGYRLSPGTIIGLEFRRFELMDFRFSNALFDNDVHFGEVLLTFRLIG